MSVGRRIAPEGASGYQFYVIDEGTADVTHEGTVVTSLGPGDHLGEMAMLGDGYPALAARIKATAEERLAEL